MFLYAFNVSFAQNIIMSIFKLVFIYYLFSSCYLIDSLCYRYVGIVGIPMIFYCTKCRLSKCNGSLVISETKCVS
jgi:hypothetical protein